MPKVIGNPMSWAIGQVRNAGGYVSDVAEAVHSDAAGQTVDQIEVRTLDLSDLRTALRKGWDDVLAFRSDVMFVCLIYPVVGAVLALLAFQGNQIQLLFPVLSGFALAGPVAAVGLFEMSRRREKGLPVNWLAYIDVMKSPKVGAVAVLALFHLVIFLAWIMAANLIFDVTLGPQVLGSVSGFVAAVFGTSAGWALIGTGMVVGFGFAVAVLAISVVSFPLLLDRKVGVVTAILTSVKVARANPVSIATWGLIVAGLLALGSVPALLGLVLVMPLLGHATWHLYRRAVV
jgi:uncharacterized membrane protein